MELEFLRSLSRSICLSVSVSLFWIYSVYGLPDLNIMPQLNNQLLVCLYFIRYDLNIQKKCLSFCFKFKLLGLQPRLFAPYQWTGGVFIIIKKQLPHACSFMVSLVRATGCKMAVFLQLSDVKCQFLTNRTKNRVNNCPFCFCCCFSLSISVDRSLEISSLLIPFKGEASPCEYPNGFISHTKTCDR